MNNIHHNPQQRPPQMVPPHSQGPPGMSFQVPPQGQGANPNKVQAGNYQFQVNPPTQAVANGNTNHHVSMPPNVEPTVPAVRQQQQPAIQQPTTLIPPRVSINPANLLPPTAPATSLSCSDAATPTAPVTRPRRKRRSIKIPQPAHAPIVKPERKRSAWHFMGRAVTSQRILGAEVLPDLRKVWVVWVQVRNAQEWVH